MNGKKLKILYHHRTQGRGAEGVHITSIVKALEEMGHSVTIVSPPGIDPLKNAGNAPLDKAKVKTSGVNSLWKVISNNVPGFIFELIEIAYNISAAWYLYKELKRNKYDLIYERYAFFLVSGSLMAKKFNIPFVLEANEVTGIKERARKQVFNKLSKKFENLLFKNCTSIFTVSSYLKTKILDQGVEPERVQVVPNAIDPQKFKSTISSQSLKIEFGLESKFIIGFAGWFDDWDRLDLLIDVFLKLNAKHPQLQLVLIGDGAVLETVREKVKEYKLEDSVLLTGAVPREKIQEYISLLDIAIFTHSNEFGSPVVMFEFMGLEVPIVAPKLLPITDVLIHNKTGILFDVLEMNQLEESINVLIEDDKLRNTIAKNAQSELMSSYTWKNNAERIIKVLELNK